MVKPTFTSTDLLDSLGYAYFELDLWGRLTYGNKTFFNALGYTRDELLGKHFRRYIEREQVSTMFNIFAMIHKTRRVEKKLPMDFVHKDGSLRTAEGSIALILNEEDEPVGFRGVLLDITERKRMETRILEQKKKAERELEIAREIQSSFLVKDYPQPDGWEVSTFLRPARQVSGDFYDVFPISTSRQIALIVADVCDKGVGAAMYMAIFRSLLRAYSNQNYIIRWAGVPTHDQTETPTGIFRRDAILASGVPSLKNAIDLTNNYIAVQHESSNMFATIFFGLLDPLNGTLAYINGGHDAPMLLSRGSLKARLGPTGPAVGMLPDMVYKTESVVLQPGDSLLLFTDGVTDAINSSGERFSDDRLIAAASHSPTSAGGMISSITSAVDEHIGAHEQYDDITLLAVHRKS